MVKYILEIHQKLCRTCFGPNTLEDEANTLTLARIKSCHYVKHMVESAYVKLYKDSKQSREYISTIRFIGYSNSKTPTYIEGRETHGSTYTKWAYIGEVNNLNPKTGKIISRK